MDRWLHDVGRVGLLLCKELIMNLYFKTIFTTITPFGVTLGMAYLIGSFLNVSFNPTEWPLDMRIVMATFGWCFGIALYMKLKFERLV